MKLKLQDTTDESLSLARAQRMNRKTVGKCFNVLAEVATEKCVYCSSYCEEKEQQDVEEDLENFLHYNLDS